MHGGSVGEISRQELMTVGMEEQNDADVPAQTLFPPHSDIGITGESGNMKKEIVVGVTGASGAIYAWRLLEVLSKDARSTSSSRMSRRR